MYSLNDKIPTKLEAISFSDLNWKENDIEELLRQNAHCRKTGTGCQS